MLTILHPDMGRNRWGHQLCECQCSCGKKVIITLTRASRAIIKSCGCLRNKSGNNSHRYSGYEEISGVYWGHLINNAKKRKINIDITIQQAWIIFLNQKRRCALSNLPIDFKENWKSNAGTASLDRIDSLKGYTIDNVQWVHKDINFMKQEFNQDIFLSYCRAIVKTNGGLDDIPL